jgi:hypothetical protein
LLGFESFQKIAKQSKAIGPISSRGLLAQGRCGPTCIVA